MEALFTFQNYCGELILNYCVKSTYWRIDSGENKSTIILDTYKIGFLK